jgi:hypothetical protein
MTPILGFLAFFFILLDLTLDRTDSFILSPIKDALETRLRKRMHPRLRQMLLPFPISEFPGITMLTALS